MTSRRPLGAGRARSCKPGVELSLRNRCCAENRDRARTVGSKRRRSAPPTFQSLTKKVRTARPNQLTIAAGRKLKIEAVNTSPSKNIKNAMPPTSRIAPIIKAARNATVPSMRPRYGRVVGRGMRQNAYGAQNMSDSCCAADRFVTRGAAEAGRREDRSVYQEVCRG